tara:strand:- start:79 stop:264 length:186 start_codon:yes stop_codon:yes gene_type:complete
MRKEVKDNLLQALGAIICVEPLDKKDRTELLIMEAGIKATLRQWKAYENNMLDAHKNDFNL